MNSEDVQNIRIGSDISIEWNVLINDEKEDLEGKDLTVVLKGPRGFRPETKHKVEGNLITIELLGMNQQEQGLYSLSLVLNKDKPGMYSFDEPNIFKLVPKSSMAGGEPSNPHVKVLVKSSLEIARGPRGATFTPDVDSEGNLSWTNDGDLPNPEPVNIKGEKGDAGKSVTHSFHGTELTMTSASGTTTVDLKGEKGDRGFSGDCNFPRFRVDPKTGHGYVDSANATAGERFYKDEKGHLIHLI